MDAFCQKTYNLTYAETVDRCFGKTQPTTTATATMDSYGQLVKSPWDRTYDFTDTEIRLARVFNEYRSALFIERRPEGKRMPGVTSTISVVLCGNTCHVTLDCYTADDDPLYEAVSDQWELRDSKGTPDAPAVDAAIETLTMESLAMCV